MTYETFGAKLAHDLQGINPQMLVRSLLRRHRSGDIRATRTLLALFQSYEDRCSARDKLYAGNEDSFQFQLKKSLEAISLKKIVKQLVTQAENGCPASIEIVLELHLITQNTNQDLKIRSMNGFSNTSIKN